MSIDTKAVLAGQVEAAAKAAGLVVVSSAVGADFSGNPTTRFQLALAADPKKTELLELSDKFDFSQTELLGEVGVYLAESAKRLKNPRPDVYLTLHGLPLSFGKFSWPFHLSTSGADTYLVHGEVKLEDGQDSPLHAKIAASMTVTFAEIVAAPEQPFAEGFIYNAVRKTMDQGQLELVKSGNRQPVPVTTRYYSRWKKKFSFNDTTAAQRQDVSGGEGVLAVGRAGRGRAGLAAGSAGCAVSECDGGGVDGGCGRRWRAKAYIWLAADTEYATPTEALMGHRAQYGVERSAGAGVHQAYVQ